MPPTEAQITSHNAVPGGSPSHMSRILGAVGWLMWKREISENRSPLHAQVCLMGPSEWLQEENLGSILAKHS